MSAVMAGTKEVKESIFGTFYIMLEGADTEGGRWATRWACFFIVLDLSQVMRTLITTEYGWSTELVLVMARLDPVNLAIRELIASFLLEWIVWVIVSLVAIAAIADALYVGSLFRDSRADRIWPIKMLRFCFAALATTFFDTVLEMLLFPIACLTTANADGESISKLIRGPDAPCTPFQVPELALTVFSLTLATIFSFFSAIACLLAFEINPLSRNPMAKFTGRIELRWISFKILATICVFAAAMVSNIPAAVVQVIAALFLLYRHVQTLPFHEMASNLARGGVYSVVCWTSISSLILSALPENARSIGDTPGVLQIVLVSCIPLAFGAGMALVQMSKQKVMKRLKQLRREHNAERGVETSVQSVRGRRADLKNWSVRDSRGSIASNSAPSFDDEQVSGVTSRKRSLWEKFFDSEWEQQVAFSSARQAHLATRVQLYNRNASDVSFVMYVVQRGIIECPGSEELMTLQLLLLRFVCQNVSAAQETEKMDKLSSRSIPIDCEYRLYSVKRCAKQETQGESMGHSGVISAINLIEFNAKLESAKKSHQDAISSMHKFWRIASKYNPAKTMLESQVEDMLMHLKRFEDSKDTAEKTYLWLLVKYPGSVAVLYSYAQFCDTVTNNAKEAEKKRIEAAMLEDEGDEVKQAAEMEMRQVTQQLRGDDRDGGASQPSIESSDAETVRSRVARFVLSWRDTVMVGEERSIQMAHFRVRFLIISLLVVATVGFFILDEVLFNEMAVKNVLLIASAGGLRAQVMEIAFLFRSKHLAAHHFEEDSMGDFAERIQHVAGLITHEHTADYETATGHVLDYFHAEHGPVDLVYGSEWTKRNASYWAVMNDFVRRARSASTVSMQELNNESFVEGDMSETKENIAFIYQNMFRSILPQIAEIVVKYRQEVMEFSILAQTVTDVTLALNIVVLFIVGVYYFRFVEKAVPEMQYMYVTTKWALSMSRPFRKKMYHFYQKIETCMLSSLEDEVLDEKGAVAPEFEGLMEGNDMPANGDDGGGGVHAEFNASGGFELGMPAAVPFTHENVNQFLQAQGVEDGARVKNFTDADDCTDKDFASDEDAHNHSEACSGFALDGAASDTGRGGGGGGRGDLSPSFVENCTGGGAFEDLMLVKKQEVKESLIEEDPASESDNEKEGGGSMFSRRTGRRGADGEDQDLFNASSTEPFSILQAVESGFLETIDRVNLLYSPPRSKSGSDAPGQENLGLRSPTGSQKAAHGGQGPPSPEGTAEGSLLAELPGRDFPFGERGGGSRTEGSRVLASPPQSVSRSQSLDSAPKVQESILRSAEPIPRDLSKGKAQKTGLRKSTSKTSFVSFSDSHQENSIAARAEPGEQQEQQKTVDFESSAKISRQLDKLAESAMKGGSKSSSAAEARVIEPKTEILPEIQEWIRKALASQKDMLSRRYFLVATFLLTFGLGFLSLMLPARHIWELVDLAILTENGSLRLMLVRSCAFLARELMLNDGFSRMKRPEMAASLFEKNKLLLEVDTAIRVGGGRKGIRYGLDTIDEHNKIMYHEGCPWRTWNMSDITSLSHRRSGVDTTGNSSLANSTSPSYAYQSATGCELDVRPGSTDRGLGPVIGTFMDSVEGVLADYGGPPSEYDFDFDKEMSQEDLYSYQKVRFSTERMYDVDTNRDMQFINASFDGDLHQGLRMIEELVFDQTYKVIGLVHYELRLLYAIYVVQICLMLYFLVVRKTMQGAYQQVAKTREMVTLVPSFLLSKVEQDSMRAYFDPAHLKNLMDEGL